MHVWGQKMTPTPNMSDATRSQIDSNKQNTRLVRKLSKPLAPHMTCASGSTRTLQHQLMRGTVTRAPPVFRSPPSLDHTYTEMTPDEELHRNISDLRVPSFGHHLSRPQPCRAASWRPIADDDDHVSPVIVAEDRRPEATHEQAGSLILKTAHHSFCWRLRRHLHACLYRLCV